MILGFTLITEAPMWLLILCLATGAGLAFMLYFRNRHNALSPVASRILAVIRFLAISLIAFLLLNPLVKRLTREKELPVIVVAMDNSESMLIHSRDTSADAKSLRGAFNDLIGALSDDYQVEAYNFGDIVSDSVQLDFNDKQTDISALFTLAENRYAGRNLGAVVMLTDGIFNSGLNPVSMTERMNTPVYTLTWGDTTVKRDLILAEVNYNRIAYLGNTFPMEIVVKASRSNGLESRLVVRNREKVFFSQPILISSDPFSKIFQVQLNADKEGILDYEVILEPLKDEVTLVNNRTRAFVEVLTSKKKVLLLGSKPHPDLGALHNALLSNDMLEAEVHMINDFRGNASAYDLIVMHQLPDDQRSADLHARVVREKVPILVIAGGKTRHEIISATGTGPLFVPGKIRGQHNEVLASLNPSFALFAPDDEFTDILSELPPLYVPFGRFEPMPGEQSLLLQRIGTVTTGYPLISFYANQGHRACYVAGEGLWKWRMYAFRSKKSHRSFDTFVSQWVQYLTASDERTRFRVSTRSQFTENTPIAFSAELYDAAYNPVTDPEISLNITSSDGNSYQYTFTRKERLYTLDAGRLPVGEYRYDARVMLGAEKFLAAGRFVVAPVHLESTVTRADHVLLRTLSGQTGGISVPVAQWAQIPDHIKNRSDIKPISHLREKFSDLTGIFWILALILLLLAAEWFVRKWAGSY
ncbi:MAG: hypothetical protein R6V49_02860 [Bacteroidales bacterium]